MAQSDTLRLTIAEMLEHAGMTPEELYALLFGQGKSAEMELSNGQMLEAWQAAHSSTAELRAIASKFDALETLHSEILPAATLMEMEQFFEGEITWDAEGMVIHRRFGNWKKGLSNFLAFASFISILSLALKLAAHAAPQLVPKFQALSTRPQDRRVLTDFIVQQLDQPSPPMIAAFAAAGITLGMSDGSMQLTQPLRTAIAGLDPVQAEKLARILDETRGEDKNTETRQLTGENAQAREITGREATVSYKNPPAKDPAAILNRMEVLERMQNIREQQQTAQQQNQRPRGTGRRMREALEREAKEKEAATAQAQQIDHPAASSHAKAQHSAQQASLDNKPVRPNPPEINQPAPAGGFAAKVSAPGMKPAKTPPPATAIAQEAGTRAAANPPAMSRSAPQAMPPLDMQLAALDIGKLSGMAGIKMEEFKPQELGKAKASLPKEDPAIAKAKPPTAPER